MRGQQNGSSKPCFASRIDELNKALALVRPVGMNDEAATAWLSVAVEETAPLSDAEFAAAVKTARRECSYHGQIVSTMLREHTERQKRMDAYRKELGALPNPWGDHPANRPQLSGDVNKLIESAAKGCKA